MESSTFQPEKSKESSDKNMNVLPPVILSSGLQSLIATVKEIKVVTTYKEVLEGLGLYIANKNLYDPQNNKICCKGDVLSSVLGTEEFAVDELKTLLPKLAVPVNSKDPAGSTSVQPENPLKRKLDEVRESDNRKLLAINSSSATSPMYLHVPPSPNYCDASDSLESIQGYETAYVKDTSDDFLSAENGDEKILAIEETYNIEYEVETETSDSELSENSSDTDAEEFCKNLQEAIIEFISKVIYIPKPDSDIEFFADASSDDDSDQSDAEISESDFWSCPKCYIKNKPTVRYCFKCFKERKNWLPDKPANMKRKQRKSRTSKRDTNKLSEASLPKCDQDFHGSNSSSGTSCENKESSADSTGVLLPNAKSLDSCNIELIDSPNIDPIHSYSIKTKNSPVKNIEFIGLTNVESSDSLYMKSSASFGTESQDSASMKSSCSSGIESSCPSSMESSGPSSMEYTGSSGIESYGPSSLESYGPSSLESCGPSSMEYAASSGIESPCPSSLESVGSSMDWPDSLHNEKWVSEKLCKICCSDSINASIIHGKFAHQISCYKCAYRLKREKKSCPVCRRTIEKVVVLIDS